jgi:KAP family P-loop domain/TIR domain
MSSIVSKYVAEEAGTITKEMLDSFKKEFNSKVELLAEIDRDTLYFDGFEDVKNEIRKLRKKNPGFRMIVFIDDLDRCSPTNALEVLESIKVFLGMEGFVYIVGISHGIITKLIDIAYEKSGIKGEEYVKKMIQIPISLPKWDKEDIVKLVKDFVIKGITHDKYKKVIDQNIFLISTAIENNPREIKRFLNNFIVAFEIFSPSGNISACELLIIQAIQLRWPRFYDLLIRSEKTFSTELRKYLEMNDEARMTILDSSETKDGQRWDVSIRSELTYFKGDYDLWNFLKNNFDTLTRIEDWSIYRRAIEATSESTTTARESDLVFMSYGRDDIGLATDVSHVLSIAGYTVSFLANEMMKEGEGWVDVAEHTIRLSAFCVILVTPSSMMSCGLEQQLDLAEKHARTVLLCVSQSVPDNIIPQEPDLVNCIRFNDLRDLEIKLPAAISNIKIRR